jgi:hypothetical protein
MRNARHLDMIFKICAVLCLALSVPMFAPAAMPVSAAQAAPPTLVGRAVLPADTLADGPKAGSALASRKTINGIKVPFDSQPVSNISAILPGDYPNTWLALSNGTFDSPKDSGDFLLRIYTLELDLHTANSGQGTVNVLDWVTLSDPQNKFPGANNSKTRELSGADFDPRAFFRARDGSYWIAEASGPSMLHFDAEGHLLDAPVSLGSGALQGMSAAPGGTILVVGQRSGGTTVTLKTFELKKRTIGQQVGTYNLGAASNNVSALTVINDHQAIVVEQDGNQGRDARFKQVFLADFGSSTAKTLLVDLLKIADTNSLSTAGSAPPNAIGLGASFMFPYADVSGVYPQDGQTLLIVNNNHVPFKLGRSSTRADDTEFVAVVVAKFDLDSALRVSR